MATISSEKLFVDIQKQLQVWTFLLPPAQTLKAVAVFPRLKDMRRRLAALLKGTWSNVWLKAPPQKRKPPAKKVRTRTHACVFRLLAAQRLRDHRKQKHRKK